MKANSRTARNIITGINQRQVLQFYHLILDMMLIKSLCNQLYCIDRHFIIFSLLYYNGLYTLLTLEF